MKLTHSIATLLLATTAALATPTGLNNIPTADSVPQETFVFQLFSTVGGDADADLNLGFKTGVDSNSPRRARSEPVRARWVPDETLRRLDPRLARDDGERGRGVVIEVMHWAHAAVVTRPRACHPDSQGECAR